MAPIVRWIKSNPRRFIALVFLMVWALLIGYILFSPQAIISRSELVHLNASEVRYISVAPAQFPGPVSQTVIIRDRKSIKAMVSIFNGLRVGFFVNHPDVTRAVTLRFQLKNVTIGGQLQDTSNKGVLFVQMSEASKGWVFSTYRVPLDRHSFEIIDKAINTKGKGTQFRRPVNRTIRKKRGHHFAAPVNRTINARLPVAEEIGTT